MVTLYRHGTLQVSRKITIFVFRPTELLHMNVLLRYFCAFLSLFLLSCGIINGQSGYPLTVHIKYDKPINGYQVTGEFFPFSDQSETGQVILRFKSISGGHDFVYSNVGAYEDNNKKFPAKLTGYNICKYIFADESTRFHDGDTLVFHYNTEPGIFEDSPLYYYAEFQFYDVDFDGKEEFLVSDFYRGRGGNNYDVYEITPKGLKKKTFKPFDRITNTTVFDADRSVITDVTHDGVFTSEYTEYRIASDGNSAKVLSHREDHHEE